MAGYFQPLPSITDGYQGMPSLYGYVNGDGRLRGTNCGLAASATLLTMLGKMPVTLPAQEGINSNMIELEKTFPPNILAGLAGTSRGRVERILDSYGCEAVELQGEDALKASLRKRQPVAVMLRVPGNTVWGITFPAGHWMVAYGYDEKNIYLTNWDIHGMSWEQFRAGWSHLIPWCINMDRRGLQAKLVT